MKVYLIKVFNRPEEEVGLLFSPDNHWSVNWKFLRKQDGHMQDVSPFIVCEMMRKHHVAPIRDWSGWKANQDWGCGVCWATGIIESEDDDGTQRVAWCHDCNGTGVNMEISA
tara:strand:+ start:59 stop:394 length:336 start_codon:yes stop_codon:yes gene_type:complete